MIVPVTSEKYRELFAQASTVVKQTIDNINDYYGHMRDYWEKQEYHLIMLPVDDAQTAETFKIDLNTRAISIPQNFAKTGAIQADQMAELIVFEVDRFFDYMDLANTRIYVQWQLPDEHKTIGVTEISIIDIKSKPGKLRFAWPLTQTITKYAGTVKFSVRFFNIGAKGLTYSLNTLEASLAVKPALDPSASPQNFDPQAGWFEDIIINSGYKNDGVMPPKVPSFMYPGQDITIIPQYVAVSFKNANEFKKESRPKFKLVDDAYILVETFTDDLVDVELYVLEEGFVRYLSDNANATGGSLVAKLNKEGELVLRAQAITNDAGTITYQWKFRADAENAPWENLGDSFTNKELSKLTFVPAEIPSNKNGRFLHREDIYYSKLPDGSYDLYKDYDIVPETPEKGGEVLYESYAEYSVPSGATDIVGTYALMATNTTHGNISNPVWSTFCYLPGPKEIQFKEKVYTVSANSIAANIETDINNPTMTYGWFYSAKNEADAINAAKADNASMAGNITFGDTALNPGWYCVRANANLNKADRAKGAPVAQVIYADPKNCFESITCADQLSYPLDKGAQQKLSLNIKVKVPTIDGVAAKDINEALYKNLSYKWEYNRQNETTWKPVTKAMIGADKLITAFDEATGDLTVQNIEDQVVYKFRCTVVNTLGKESYEETMSDVFLIY